MRLYLIRHGKARARSDTGRDQDRELARKGRTQSTWLGSKLAGGDRPPETLLTSPAARAMATAVIIAEHTGLTAEIDPRLSLATTASDVIELIGALPSDVSIALVGHNPTLSVVADVLCDGPTGRSTIELRTGQAAVIEMDSPADGPGGARLIGTLRAESE